IAEFEAAAQAACGELFADYGDLPRARAADQVSESTPYPADEMILFHNESAHHSQWPMRINFHCVVPASRGGCTPVLDTRLLMRELDPSVVAAFREKGLTYLRNFSDGIEPSWQTFFRTTDRAAVEATCRAGGYTYEWRADGGLRMRKRTIGVAKHPVTREEVFFNQVQHHHIACLDEDTREGMRELFADDDLPRHVSYGDGSPIADETMKHIGEVYERVCVRFPWQAGDVIMLDNMLTAHARDPFEGPRRIVVAMAQMIGADELPE
ncbi:MAG: TauD/TfdA family dioxygenase, partial [Candidatus Eremiobacteraeota bacterium]|nr:TauD/TfdA family dioxygenase [Candidatus Eremiobacteraeota bacterium]